MMPVARLIVCSLLVDVAVATRTARDATSDLVRQQGKERLMLGTGKILGELSTAEGMLKKELHGHPEMIQREMQLLQKAEGYARHMRGTAHDSVQAHSVDVQKVKVSAEQLEKQRNQMMTSQLQAERKFGKAERELSKDGEKIQSEFGEAEDLVAQAFAGKDSKGVQTAMHVGQLLEKAVDEQKKVTKLNAAQAASSEKEASVLAAALAQTSAKSNTQQSLQSKAEQEEHAYATGMASLAKDDKAQLVKFADAKTAIAEAFAGKDSKAVEKAMEVGEMLDEARKDQQKVADMDAKDAADAPRLFNVLGKGMAHESAKSGFLQSNVKSSVATEASLQSELKSMKAKEVSHLVSLGQREEGVLRMTEHAEDAITRNLAKDGSHAAMMTEHEVIAMMEQAKHYEEEGHRATQSALHAAQKSK